MRAISLWQPWATAAVLDIKGPETRGWYTNIREIVAIHAAVKPAKEIINLIGQEEANKLEKYLNMKLEELPYGAIVGTVDIVDCVPVEQIKGTLSEREIAFGDYSKGRYAWTLKNQIAFEKPIPAKGKQGFWTWDGVL